MNDVIIKVGGSIEEDGAAFISAWKRAEAGEQFCERQVAFESWELLTKTLTGKRMELLRHLHRHPAPSILALAKSLNRQYRRVHEDVEALVAAGLLDKGDGGLSASYDVLRTDIAL
jgi:predicted transcriptional regulator